MSQRLENALKIKGPGLITYLMAGDPDPDTTLRRLLGLAQSGVNVLELGVPFSDPIADGPVIQAAGLRALESFMDLKKVLKLVHAFRRQNQDTPLLLMSYLNPLLSYGYERFLKDAVQTGVDGLILPDLPWRESRPFRQKAQETVKNQLVFIPMIAQTSLPEHIQSLTELKDGFVYVLSRNGITGGQAEIPPHILNYIQNLKENLTLPRYVGFGIQAPEQVAKLSEVCEGVVVGSALVKKFAQIDALNLPEDEKVEREQEVYQWITSLRGNSV
ncbi:tryptophan synthase subunit alpha [Desulfitobacterium sp. Sab5]|uniref:tryptophan synthase subunit alpha n=1 Tax=Desulfitobacterium nosdiversum TaxID=3375356 RepID=UPI003CF1D62C